MPHAIPTKKIDNRAIGDQPLDFLWLELTGRCNLSCVHCYSDSGPDVNVENELTVDEQIGLLDSAAALGCRQVQFIGGEPTLFRDICRLIEHARQAGFEFIELYTNGTRLSDELLSCLVRNRVAVATSFYCDDSSIHDKITKHRNSHALTVRNIKKFIAKDVKLRVAIIAMEENRDRIRQTEEFLRQLGVSQIAVDHMRGVGRGAKTENSGERAMAELCGHCWKGRLCIAPDGAASACVMSRAWPVGSIRERSLADIVASQELSGLRNAIYAATKRPKKPKAPKGPKRSGIIGPPPCTPGEPPCNPQCLPSFPCTPPCPPPCTPTDHPGCPPPCTPTDKCMPLSTAAPFVPDADRTSLR